MVRCKTYIGLNNKARNYLARRMKRGTLMEVTDRITQRPLQIGAHHTYFTDAFGYDYGFSLDSEENRPFVFYLRVFRDLIRNRLIYECVEASPWAGGPNEMTFLKDEFGNVVRCSSYCRYEEGECRIYDDSGKWVTGAHKEMYENMRFLGKNKSKSNRAIVC